MGEWQAGQDRRRAREFEAFVAGAAGRLLHVSALLATERFGLPAESPPAGSPAPRDAPGGAAPYAGSGPAPSTVPIACALLLHALTRTYADWDTVRCPDPYDRARQELVLHFAHTAWRHRRPRGGVLGPLTPQERVVLVLRIHEGVAEEQVAAVLGLSEERVRALCGRAVQLLRERSRLEVAG